MGKELVKKSAGGGGVCLGGVRFGVRVVLRFGLGVMVMVGDRIRVRVMVMVRVRVRVRVKMSVLLRVSLTDMNRAASG